MDTKWNDSTEKGYGFLTKRGQFFAGILFVLLGLYVLWRALYFYTVPSPEDTIVLTLLSNLLLGIGVFYIANAGLNKKYENWIPQEETFYQDWRTEKLRQRKFFYIVGFVLLLIAVVIDWISYPMRFVATITTLVQLLVYQNCFVQFMSEKLDMLMNQMEEINQNNLKKALEIEKKSLEKISRSDQLRIDLITNVSHDLKTPVTSMVGYLELIKKEELSDVVRDYVEVVCNKTEKLKEMIESLFSLAKASSGNVKLHMEKFELNRLIEQIMADLKDQIEESDLHFVTQLTEEHTEITSDNMYLYRICQNLLENALKYSARETRIFIKTYIKEENLCMEITNTAGYLMDFNKEDILERFVRGDKSRTTDGNGLGLAIVSTYTKALGGEFDIRIDCDQFKAYLAFPKVKTL